MSTKVYHAWRIEPAQLKKFDLDFENHVYKQASILFDELVTFVDDEKVYAELLPKKKHRVSAWGNAKNALLATKIEMTQRLCFEASHSSYKEAFDLDCGYNIFLDGKHFLIMPWGREKLYSKFSKGYQQWCYWNNTDQDESVSPKEWNDRRKSWGRIDDDKRFSRTIIEMRDYTSRANFLEKYAKKQNLVIDKKLFHPAGYALAWIDTELETKLRGISK
jgi:hypothetical protein